MKIRVNGLLLLSLAFGVSGCTTVSKVGLMSKGELEGKTFDGVKKNQVVTGESCGLRHSLATAFINSIKDTSFDTVIDADVESTTNLFTFGNCVKISGYGVNSAELAYGDLK